MDDYLGVISMHFVVLRSMYRMWDIFWLLIFQILFGVLEIPDYFSGEQ